jgi:hypothetical protein
MSAHQPNGADAPIVSCHDAAVARDSFVALGDRPLRLRAA